MKLRGDLDAGALAAALADLVDRHLPLRTAVEMADGAAFGHALSSPRPDEALTVADLSHLSETSRDGELRSRMGVETARPLDLSRDLLLRACLYRLGEQEHVLLLVIHHAAIDDLAMAVLADELQTAYRARRLGAEPRFLPLPIAYCDAAAEQRLALESGALADEVAYWRGAMAGAPALLDLPVDKPRRPGRDRKAGVVTLRVEPGMVAAIDERARHSDASRFAVILAAYAATLGRLAGAGEVVIGVPVAARTRVEVERLVGLFANVLPLRIDLSGDPDVEALVDRAKASLLGAMGRQQVPFEHLVEELAPPRSLAYTPLFQAAFTWRIDALASLALPDLEAESVFVTAPCAKYDLTLNLFDMPDGAVAGFLEFDASVFNAESVERWSRYFLRMLDGLIGPAVTRAPRVQSVALLDDEERRLVVEQFNRTADHATRSTIATMFERAAEITPRAVAVIADDETLTYGELDASANRLARWLIAKGVGPDAVVGVALERSARMIVAVLGIAKAGGAYCPLDASYPTERLKFMVDDAQPVCILTTADVAARLGGGSEFVRLDEPFLAASIDAQSADAVDGQRTGRAAGSREPCLCDVYVGLNGNSKGRPDHAGQCRFARLEPELCRDHARARAPPVCPADVRRGDLRNLGRLVERRPNSLSPRPARPTSTRSLRL